MKKNGIWRYIRNVPLASKLLSGSVGALFFYIWWLFQQADMEHKICVLVCRYVRNIS